MAKQPKTFKVELAELPYLPYDGEVMEGSHQDFVNKAGGELAKALFKGNFESELYQWLTIAHARGKKAYHEQLICGAKTKHE